LAIIAEIIDRYMLHKSERQRDILTQMVSRVVIDLEGRIIRTELKQLYNYFDGLYHSGEEDPRGQHPGPTTKKPAHQMPVHFSLHLVGLRGNHPFTGHTHEFELPVPHSTVADQRNPDKAKLKETNLVLRAMGWNYRRLDARQGWTRVGQILKGIKKRTRVLR
jgi:hypothetical protein